MLNLSRSSIYFIWLKIWIIQTIIRPKPLNKKKRFLVLILPLLALSRLSSNCPRKAIKSDPSELDGGRQEEESPLSFICHCHQRLSSCVGTSMSSMRESVLKPGQPLELPSWGKKLKRGIGYYRIIKNVNLIIRWKRLIRVSFLSYRSVCVWCLRKWMI